VEYGSSMRFFTYAEKNNLSMFDVGQCFSYRLQIFTLTGESAIPQVELKMCFYSVKNTPSYSNDGAAAK
jgi:hypothetical protein